MSQSDQPLLKWEEFITAVRRDVGRPNGPRIYRGHARSEWLLASIFERWLRRLKGNTAERNLRECFSQPGGLDFCREAYLRHFKVAASGLPGIRSRDLTDTDWWVLGRHFGLITPLLDWSRSPYVAAFFAVVDHLDQHNVGFRNGLSPLGFGEGGIRHVEGRLTVWCLTIVDELQMCREVEVIQPSIDFSVPAHRIRAQQSLFTRLTHDVHVDLESFLRARDLHHCIARFDINGIEAFRALKDLNLMNVSYATLFPDLGGAALQANLTDTLHLFGD